MNRRKIQQNTCNTLYTFLVVVNLVSIVRILFFVFIFYSKFSNKCAVYFQSVEKEKKSPFFFALFLLIVWKNISPCYSMECNFALFCIRVDVYKLHNRIDTTHQNNKMENSVKFHISLEKWIEIPSKYFTQFSFVAYSWFVYSTYIGYYIALIKSTYIFWNCQ